MKTVVWHGEGRTLFYTVDEIAPEEEQPCVITTRRAKGGDRDED